MALFRKKTTQAEKATETDGATPTIDAQPEKARKWFEHAKTAAMASNYDYALECYAQGIRLDPAAHSAHESMLEAAKGYLRQGAKPARGKEVRAIDDGTPAGKFAAAEFEWMKDLNNYKRAARSLEAAVKADQLELGNWMASRVFLLMRSQKKMTKSVLLQAMELFRNVGAWDESMEAGEMARQLDPTDSGLDAELKNLSAQRAMDQGGYTEAIGEEGGFRKFIKDEDKQRELVDAETLATGASVDERNLARARSQYEETPETPDVINRYAQLLKKKGTPEAAEQAHDIYRRGFDATGEFRFHMSAGDIRIEQLGRTLRELEEKLEAAPDSAELAEQRDEIRGRLLDLKLSEYEERVAKYPTDRMRKFELGETLYELRRFEDAMAQYQKAKDEPKLRVAAGHQLGRCFLAEEWYSEAISEFEDALQATEVSERERDLAIRYDLMLALIGSAREDDSIDLARQAKTICSDIARKNITYRDIRAKRREVDELIKGMSGE